MSKHSKRYHISYASGATGYGWEEETDSIEEARHIARSDDFGKHYTASLTIWDEEIQDFIFWKSVLEYKPKIDRI